MDVAIIRQVILIFAVIYSSLFFGLLVLYLFQFRSGNAHGRTSNITVAPI